MFACYQPGHKTVTVLQSTSISCHCTFSSLQSWVLTSLSVTSHSNMGNNNTACQLSNYSKRNMRIFITEKAEEIDAFITSQVVAADDPGEDHSLSGLPGGKKFTFRKDVSCVRVLASQTQEVPWEPQRFLSVFVEDEEDENICSKQIVHSMALNAPITVLLYDV